MVTEVHPVSSIRGTVAVPGSKSITNRALICSAIAEGTSVLSNASDSDDTALMINGLNQLGILVRREETTLVVEGRGGRLFAPKFPIPVGNAGTTLRFLLSLASLAEGDVIFEVSPRMMERPITELLDGLRTLGVGTAIEESLSRYRVTGGSLTGGRTTVRADKSSQFLSSLLLVAPYARDGVQIDLAGEMSSAPYVMMTLRVMEAFGVRVRRNEQGSYLSTPSRYRGTQYAVESDMSGASYFLGAVAITGGEVRFPGLSSASIQGDSEILTMFGSMGCTVLHTQGETIVRGTGAVVGVDVDMNAMPDMVPTLAAVALFAKGTTRIRHVEHLRFKESDRLAALGQEFAKLGAQVRITGDGIEIEPVPLHGALLDTHDDHRLAMSFAIIGLRVPGVRIGNPECVKKSFPRFWDQLRAVTGGE
jgi:3-phosphoshikimate 1-carboxyvinyltransferase